MAKRKATETPTPNTPKTKKPRGAGTGKSPDKATAQPQEDFDPQQEYKIKEILKEDRRYYLIAWEDHEATGESYKPTWEPKANANEAAVADWREKQARLREQKKARKRKSFGPAASPARKRGKTGGSSATTASPALSRDPTAEGSSPAPRAATPRRRNIVPSSSSQEASSAAKGRVEAESEKIEPEIPETQPASLGAVAPDSPLFVSSEAEETPRARSEQLNVQLSDPPSSYQRGAYQRFDDSQRNSGAEEPSPLPSSAFGPLAAETGREIPDSDPSSASVRQTQTQGTQENRGVGSSQLVPESQSRPEQQQAHPSSSFRGFSPDLQPKQNPSAQVQDCEQQEAAQHSFETQDVQSAGTASGATQAYTREEQQNPSQPEVASQHSVTKESFVRSGSDGRFLQQTQPRTDFPKADDSFEGEPRDTETVNGTSDAADETTRHSPARIDDKPSTGASTRENTPTNRAANEDEEITAEGGNQETSPGKGASQFNREQQKITDRSQTEGAATTSSEKSIEELGASLAFAINGSEGIVVESSAPPISSTQFLSQPDYEPPPAGQRPVESSVLEGAQILQSLKASSQPSPSKVPAQSASEAITSPNFFFSSQPRAQRQNLVTQSLPATPSPLRFQTQISPRPRVRSIEKVQRSELNFGPGQKSPESSPFPSVPSQSIGTVGESAPGRIPTPSQNSFSVTDSKPRTPIRGSGKKMAPQWMTDQDAQTPSSRQKTPAVVVQPASSLPPNISAEVAAARQGSPMLDSRRSPSTVPAMEAEPAITMEEMNTSERYDTLIPQAQGRNGLSPAQLRNRRAVPGTLSEQFPHPHEPSENLEAASVHSIPIVLGPHQRDQYFQNIYFQKKAIDGFLEEQQPSEEQIVDAETVVERLRSISMHPDLVNHDALSQVSTPERQAQWDVDSSAKFRFLNQLFRMLSERNMHLALVAAGYKVPDMLETFLRGTSIPYNRDPSARADFHASSLGLRVSIIDLEQDVASIDSAHLVIAMDGSVNYRHPVIRAARQQRTLDMTQTFTWATLLTLVVPFTVEHIERCLAPGMSRKARAHVILSATRRVKDIAGKAEAGQVSPEKSATVIADFLQRRTDDTEWPITGLSMIDDLDSQTETELSQEVASFPRTRSKSPGKRPYAESGVGSPEDASKRPRLDEAEMPGTINPQEIEVTHISDSMGKGTQTNIEMGDVFAPSGPSEAQAEALEEARSFLAEYEKALEDVQYRFEEQHAELVKVRQARDSEMTRAEAALERLSVTEMNNTTLRDERTLLKEQLADANARVADISIPERQEFERLRLEVQLARVEKEKAEKKVAGLEKELDWTRKMYQDSSSQARDLAEQNTDLEGRLVRAEKQASGEQARALQMSQDMKHKALERENKKLKGLLKNREDDLKQMDERLQREQAGRGRIATRQSSVPRSPRLGSPVHKGGRGSRQTSPSAGELRPRGGLHPLRNG
ncbi:unnamed protein product [Lecanosticta acicola]|uniref:Unnamed protein product n=1 Tax=Lecanosticta acicola TaxID=111012 RepID=A0AAI9EAZ3_9PEZI|nr:unnamed protein product [Lecanosticta acicola]